MINSLINGDISTYVFLLIALGSLIIVMFLIFNSYKKCKMKRNMNLYIMNNGVCIEETVDWVKHTYTQVIDIGYRGFHNTIAEVRFTYNGIE